MRWKTHQGRLLKGKHHSNKLQSDWNSYGPDTFRFEVVELVTDHAQLFAAEQRWIDCLSPEYNTKVNAVSNKTPVKGFKRKQQERQREWVTKPSFTLEMVTPEQIAQRMRVSQNMILQLIKRGELPATRFGKLWRIKESDLEDYLSRNYTHKKDNTDK